MPEKQLMMTQANSDEKRQFHRIGYQTDATVSNPSHRWPVKIVDLSLKGCLVERPESWEVCAGKTYQIEIQLAESVEINMDVILAHQTSSLAGFRCDHIDLDSICRLRRLVELNLGDSDLLDRDLEAFAHSG